MFVLENASQLAFSSLPTNPFGLCTNSQDHSTKFILKGMQSCSMKRHNLFKGGDNFASFHPPPSFNNQTGLENQTIKNFDEQGFKPVKIRGLSCQDGLKWGNQSGIYSL
jgi:hypothetical protein